MIAYHRTKQEESRSISENIRWSLQKKFRQGKVTVTIKRFLGYEANESGELVVNPAEAEIVRRIFWEYIAGKSIRDIKRGLEGDGIKTVTGLDKWPEATLSGVLTNEKYYGDAILQKTYTVDYLTHKKKKNRVAELLSSAGHGTVNRKPNKSSGSAAPI